MTLEGLVVSCNTCNRTLFLWTSRAVLPDGGGAAGRGGRGGRGAHTGTVLDPAFKAVVVMLELVLGVLLLLLLLVVVVVTSTTVTVRGDLNFVAPHPASPVPATVTHSASGDPAGHNWTRRFPWSAIAWSPFESMSTPVGEFNCAPPLPAPRPPATVVHSAFISAGQSRIRWLPISATRRSPWPSILTSRGELRSVPTAATNTVQSDPGEAAEHATTRWFPASVSTQSPLAPTVTEAGFCFLPYVDVKSVTVIRMTVARQSLNNAYSVSHQNQRKKLRRHKLKGP